MKSPTKEDFTEENQQQQEEEIEILRKIKVKILDPDATDSSSDDEQEKRPKLIVHEIVQDKVKIPSFSVKNKNPLDFYQFSGKLPRMVRKRKSGKFTTEITNPFNKKRIWLGTFDTPEEASQVYESKRLEFEEELEKAKSSIVETVNSAKSEIGSSSSRDPPLMVDSQTSDSSVKTRFSIENRKPLSFDRFSGKLPRMVRLRKTGKFTTEITNPFNKKRIWLGTFDTAEEASQVYESKRLEFEEELKKAKNSILETVSSAKSEIGSSSSSRNPPLMDDSQISDSYMVKTRFSLENRKPLSFDQFSGKLPRMVRLRKTGKFTTEITNPFNKKRIWLGTFDTAEEASRVYESKKLEFEEELKKAKNSIVETVVSAESEIGSSSSSSYPPLMVATQNTHSSNEFDERLKRVTNAKEKKDFSAKSELGPSSSSRNPPLMADSQTSDLSNGVEENDEQMWMGNWVRISGGTEVKFSQKLGVPIVDNYGFLLGEFSKLDDLSISA